MPKKSKSKSRASSKKKKTKKKVTAKKKAKKKLKKKKATAGKKAAKKPARKKAGKKAPAKKKKAKKPAKKKAAKKPARKKPAKKKAPVKAKAAKKVVAAAPLVEPGPQPTGIPPVEEPAEHEEAIGTVTHYYSHIEVAVIQLNKGTLRTGDAIRIKGHTTDFTQTVESMEYEHQHIDEATAGQSFGIKVRDHVREHDIVYLEK